jgi:hypothetical protein
VARPAGKQQRQHAARSTQHAAPTLDLNKIKTGREVFQMFATLIVIGVFLSLGKAGW